MKQLNTPWGLALLTLFIVFYGLHHIQPHLSDGLLLVNSFVAALVIGAIRHLTLAPVLQPAIHPDLPQVEMRALKESLHHSQMTLYFNIMQPMLAARFPDLVNEVIGKKPSHAPFTRFDEKVVLLQQAFKQLATSNVLYVKRAFEDCDRALTMLVFLRILWQEKPQASLPSLLKSIPTQLYPMLRGQVYRLYDLPLLFTQGKLLANEPFSTLLEGLIGLNSEQQVIAASDVFPADQESPSSTSKMPGLAIEPISLIVDSTNQTLPDCLPDFVNWLQKRIASGNKQFSLDSQELVLCNLKQYGPNKVFLLPEILGKYQSRSGLSAKQLEDALKQAFSNQKQFHIKNAGHLMEVMPCLLNEAFTTDFSTLILEGSFHDHNN